MLSLTKGESMKIYFDMDDVIANFSKGMLELCNIRPFGQNNFKMVNLLYSRMREIDHYYSKLEPIQEAVDLMMELYEKYGDDVQILTAIPKPHRKIPDAAEDKIDWVKRLISEDIKVNTCYRAEKINFCTSEDCILIDDFFMNVDEWEAAGGTGILYKDINEVRKILKDKGIL